MPQFAALTKQQAAVERAKIYEHGKQVREKIKVYAKEQAIARQQAREAADLARSGSLDGFSTPFLIGVLATGKDTLAIAEHLNVSRAVIAAWIAEHPGEAKIARQQRADLAAFDTLHIEDGVLAKNAQWTAERMNREAYAARADAADTNESQQLAAIGADAMRALIGQMVGALGMSVVATVPAYDPLKKP